MFQQAFILIISKIEPGSSLRLLMLDVPSPIVVGDSVELTCSFEMDEDQLYSVKWYKSDVEFYRYVPNDWPPGQTLPIPGVKVDVSCIKIDLKNRFLIL